MDKQAKQLLLISSGVALTVFLIGLMFTVTLAFAMSSRSPFGAPFDNPRSLTISASMLMVFLEIILIEGLTRVFAKSGVSKELVKILHWANLGLISLTIIPIALLTFLK